ncbi:unnamed protein product [Linum trigynum]|uniref:Uncharacterized protein n=1 Tax=Linum trigynum TaxID=586398 RepID=A0AAV2F2G8_9ROSI
MAKKGPQENPFKQTKSDGEEVSEEAPAAEEPKAKESATVSLDSNEPGTTTISAYPSRRGSRDLKRNNNKQTAVRKMSFVPGEEIENVREEGKNIELVAEISLLNEQRKAFEKVIEQILGDNEFLKFLVEWFVIVIEKSELVVWRRFPRDKSLKSVTDSQ